VSSNDRPVGASVAKAALRQYRLAQPQAFAGMGRVVADGAAARLPSSGGSDATTRSGIRFADNKGPVLSPVHIWPIFWGSSWSTDRAPTAGDVTAAVTRVVTGPFMSALDQYRVVQPGTVARATLLASSEPPNPFSNQDVVDILYGLLLAGAIPEPDDDPLALYTLFLPPGVTSIDSSIGEHSYFAYYNLTHLWLADAGLGSNVHYAWTANNGSLDFVTTVFSHELVEACTDPEGTTILGVEGTCAQSGWCEIGDVCTGTTGQVDGVSVQSYWSQRDLTCVIPSRGAVADATTPAADPARTAEPSVTATPVAIPSGAQSSVAPRPSASVIPLPATPVSAPATPATPPARGALNRILQLDLPPAFFFWVEFLYLIALIVGAILWVKGTWLHDYLPEQIGPIPISIPWFGALGAVLISIAGISAHNVVGGTASTRWDPSYNFWHIARPLVGAAVGTVGYLMLAAVLDATRVAGTTPSSPGVRPVSNLIAFLFGYREESFRELIKRAVDLLLQPGVRGGASGTPPPSPRP